MLTTRTERTDPTLIFSETAEDAVKAFRADPGRSISTIKIITASEHFLAPGPGP
ncbi:MAG: hypothetical protein HOW97_11990 [Catenulispora sp.]|nr:hypothetical protein [Catenulispora sp.]